MLITVTCRNDSIGTDTSGRTGSDLRLLAIIKQQRSIDHEKEEVSSSRAVPDRAG